MCLMTLKEVPIITASADIQVIKILKRKYNPKAHGSIIIVSPYEDYPYDRYDQAYPHVPLIPEGSNSIKRIDQGYHSLLSREDAIEHVGISSMLGYIKESLVLAECTIPAGADFCVGTADKYDIVSSTIILRKVLDYVFE